MSNDGRKISSLRDMPRDIAPPRDLWQGIEARLGAESRGVELPVARATEVQGTDWSGRRRRIVNMRVLAAAAVVAALAVGIWIGRAMLPVPGQPQPTGTGLTAHQDGVGNGSAVSNGGQAIPTSLVMDPKYMRQRAQMLQNVQAQIAALPPDSRTKVMSSLRTIHDSMQDLEAALGKDPSNALLQELLVNTYQDEMRVLTAVHEAGNSGEGI
jgi:hypothetical protein